MALRETSFHNNLPLTLIRERELLIEQQDLSGNKSKDLRDILKKSVLVIIFLSLVITIAALIVTKRSEPLEDHSVHNMLASPLTQNMTSSQENSTNSCPNCSSAPCPNTNCSSAPCLNTNCSSTPCPNTNCSSPPCPTQNCTSSPCLKNHSSCKTADCFLYAAKLLGSLDTSVNPCDNFYQYACGNWIKKEDIDDTQAIQQEFVKQTVIINKRIRNILESPTSRFTTVLNKPRIAYNACMNQNESEAYKTLAKQINSSKVGWPILSGPTWKNKRLAYGFDNVLKLLVTLRREGWMGNVLFKTFVHKNLLNNTNTILTLSQPKVNLLPNELFVDVVTLFILELRSLGSEIDFTYIRMAAWEMLLLRNMIIECLDLSGGLVEDYQTMTIEEFTVLTKWRTKRINWLAFFNGLVENVTVLKSTDKIAVVNYNYFKKFGALVSGITNLKSVIDFEMLNAIQPVIFDIMEIDSLKESLISKLVNYESQIEYPREKPKWLKCVTFVGYIFQSVLAAEYVHQYFETDKEVKAIDEFATILADTFRERIHTLSWLDDVSKEKARLKLKAMKRYYLYPAWANDSTSVEKHYRDLEIGKDHTLNTIKYSRFIHQKMFNKLNPSVDNFDDWDSNPLEVNAFYSQLSNSFFINAGMLQPPFFDSGRLYAMNFGSIGTVIGHEITHGFDLMGVKFNSVGNLDNWLTPGTKHAFAQKSECFIDQYSKFKLTAQDLPSLMFYTKLQVNGTVSASENIADNVGLQQAFWAYQNWKVKNGPEKLPDVLQNFTAEQIFFISFSQHWCTKYSNSEDLAKRVATSKHSPPKFRVLGSVANFDEFYKAFNCPARQQKQLCNIW